MKQENFTFGTTIVSFDYFGLQLQKTIAMYEINALKFLKLQSVIWNKKTFENKIAPFEYFWENIVIFESTVKFVKIHSFM